MVASREPLQQRRSLERIFLGFPHSFRTSGKHRSLKPQAPQRSDCGSPCQRLRTGPCTHKSSWVSSGWSMAALPPSVTDALFEFQLEVLLKKPLHMNVHMRAEQPVPMATSGICSLARAFSLWVARASASELAKLTSS